MSGHAHFLPPSSTNPYPETLPLCTAKLVQPATNARSFPRKTPCCQNMQPHHRCCQNTRLNSSNLNLIDCRGRTPWQGMASRAALHTHTYCPPPPHFAVWGGGWRVQGSGSRVWERGFADGPSHTSLPPPLPPAVCGVGFRVQNSGFRVQGLGLRPRW